MSPGDDLRYAACRFECPDCGKVSHNCNDVLNAYCGHCHAWFSRHVVTPEARQAAEEIAASIHADRGRGPDDAR